MAKLSNDALLYIANLMGLKITSSTQIASRIEEIVKNKNYKKDKNTMVNTYISISDKNIIIHKPTLPDTLFKSINGDISSYDAFDKYNSWQNILLYRGYSLRNGIRKVNYPLYGYRIYIGYNIKKDIFVEEYSNSTYSIEYKLIVVENELTPDKIYIHTSHIQVNFRNDIDTVDIQLI